MRQKIPQLDGVRGLAILVVMIHNSWKFPRLFANGWMGVDLFFVLSGFLITGILLDSKQSEGYFKIFYVRRCLRILPLYYALLIFMFVIVPLLRSSDAHVIFEKSSPWWAFPLFLQNFLIPISTNAAGALAVTWSLAIEEQFYLVWALVVRYMSHAQIRWIAIAVICLSPGLRFYLSPRHVYLYTNVFCRLDGLMAGSLLALAVRSDDFMPSRFVRAAWVCLGVSAPLSFLTQAFRVEWIVYSFTAVASASFVFLALFSAQKWLRMALGNRFLVYTGTISYGLYLLHKIPLDAEQSFRLERYPLLSLLAVLVASYAAATLSWNLLEKPFLRLKRYFEPVAIARLDPANSHFALVPQERS